MAISSGISGFYPMYNANPVTPVSGADLVTRGTEGPVTTEQIKPHECQTCKNRKYVDQSNEGNVSFQAPAHISPEQSATTVMGHEQEHVTNARNKGNEAGNKLVSASVQLHTSICPECGRVYVSGGTTTSTIASSYNTSNPYEQNRKQSEGSLLAGSYVNEIA